MSCPTSRFALAPHPSTALTRLPIFALAFIFPLLAGVLPAISSSAVMCVVLACVLLEASVGMEIPLLLTETSLAESHGAGALDVAATAAAVLAAAEENDGGRTGLVAADDVENAGDVEESFDNGGEKEYYHSLKKTIKMLFNNN